MKKITEGLLAGTLFFLVACPAGAAVDAEVGYRDPVAVGVPPFSEDAAQTRPSDFPKGAQYVTLSKPGKDVFVKDRSGKWVAAEDGMVILPGDEVRTAQGSSVEVILDSGKVGHIEIKGGSLFKVSQAETDPVTGDQKTLLDLAVGKILVKAQALKGNSRFEVRTPSSLTGVRGTLFEVEVEGKLGPMN